MYIWIYISGSDLSLPRGCMRYTVSPATCPGTVPAQPLAGKRDSCPRQRSSAEGTRPAP